MPKVRLLQDIPELGLSAGEECYLSVPETERKVAAGIVERAGKRKRKRKVKPDAGATTTKNQTG